MPSRSGKTQVFVDSLPNNRIFRMVPAEPLDQFYKLVNGSCFK